MARKRKHDRLDAYEQAVEESLEEYSPVPPEERIRIMQLAAKTKTISLRINENVLQVLKRKAADEGLPYQTLISSVLYKFSTDRLVDAREVRKALASLKAE
jgi:predicted DNA binding CopG/RHH family protein